MALVRTRAGANMRSYRAAQLGALFVIRTVTKQTFGAEVA
jgi:hypothetical protein